MIERLEAMLRRILDEFYCDEHRFRRELDVYVEGALTTCEVTDGLNDLLDEAELLVNSGGEEDE